MLILVWRHLWIVQKRQFRKINNYTANTTEKCQTAILDKSLIWYAHLTNLQAFRIVITVNASASSRLDGQLTARTSTPALHISQLNDQLMRFIPRAHAHRTRNTGCVFGPSTAASLVARSSARRARSAPA